jgi:hypothetical protein
MNCNFNTQLFTVRVRKAKLSFTRIAASERKGLYSRVLNLVLFDTSFESESVTLYLILYKNKSHFWADLLLWKKIK